MTHTQCQTKEGGVKTEWLKTGADVKIRDTGAKWSEVRVGGAEAEQELNEEDVPDETEETEKKFFFFQDPKAMASGQFQNVCVKEWIKGKTSRTLKAEHKKQRCTKRLITMSKSVAF